MGASMEVLGFEAVYWRLIIHSGLTPTPSHLIFAAPAVAMHLRMWQQASAGALVEHSADTLTETVGS